MAIDEGSRHALFTRLEELLGQEHATALMEHLPPVGWADVATRNDLAQLEQRIGLRFEATEQRLLATFRAELNANTRTLVFSMFSAMLGTSGLTVGLLRLV